MDFVHQGGMGDRMVGFGARASNVLREIIPVFQRSSSWVTSLPNPARSESPWPRITSSGWSLGLNHEKLTCRYSGRNYRPTDVHGHVVRDIIA